MIHTYVCYIQACRFSIKKVLKHLDYAPGSGRAEHKMLESRLLVARRRRSFRVLLATLFTSEIDILFA